MANQFHKSSGFALILGSLLMICTMILHPSGGSIKHIIAISNTIIAAHSLAIFSLPIILFGFYGLSDKLSESYKISTLALMIIAFGLIEAMLAALINGLAIPYFLEKYADNPEMHESIIKPIIIFGFSMNKPLDYVFIGAFCLAISLYSLLMIRTRKMPVWLGYYGILLMAASVTGALTGFVFTSLMGFRIFVFSLAGWILITGYFLIRKIEINE